MARIVASTIIAAPIERVWALLRDFNGHASWHPAVAQSRIDFDEPADKVGAVRNFELRAGGRIREQLLSLSDREHRLRYFIVEAPVALYNYVAELRLCAVTSDQTTWCQWRAEFEPPLDQRDALTRFVRDEIIAAGFAAIKQALASDSAPPRPSIIARSDRGEAAAVVLTRYGGPEVLELRALSLPPPAAGEARLRQTAIGVNFIDVYCRRGSFKLVPPGGILGMEAAGVVESVGPGVSNVRAGDRVAYACAPPGAYATSRNMRADMLAPLPSSLSEKQAAAILLKGITASFLLHDVHAVKPGDCVMVHAAAGGVGQILCQWAKAMGARVIGVVSTPTKAGIAKQAGAELALLSDAPDLVVEARGFTGGKGVDVVYDAVGASTFELSLDCLALRGHLVSFGQASGDVGERSIDRLAARSVTLSRPNYAHYTDTPDMFSLHAARLFAALDSGAVRATTPSFYPLAEAARAHADLEARRTTGAIVLEP